MDRGIPIRAISRSLAILQAINRGRSVTMMEIATATDLPYPTVCRIVQTLMHEGLVEQEPTRKNYRPTALVKTLSQGFQDDDLLVSLARPHIVDVTRKLGWPVSLTTRVGNSIVLKDTTHALTSLTLLNYHPGYSLPLLECASGKAYMAFCPDDERETILQGLRQLESPTDLVGRHVLQSGLALSEIRAQGYATQARNLHTETPGKTSSIAVPVFGSERVVAVLAIIFFASAMTMNEAVAAFRDPMQKCAKAVSEDFDQAISAAA